jgi:hypothetical protein
MTTGAYVDEYTRIYKMFCEKLESENDEHQERIAKLEGDTVRACRENQTCRKRDERRNLNISEEDLQESRPNGEIWKAQL